MLGTTRSGVQTYMNIHPLNLETNTLTTRPSRRTASAALLIEDFLQNESYRSSICQQELLHPGQGDCDYRATALQ